MKRVAGAAMILALLAACPAFAREASDEAGLLADAARTENALRQSPVVERDAALNAYLRGVLCRVAGDQCGDLRLYIINQPDFGASTLPNGAIEIGAGLVWRAANEDQLAFILSREIAHYSEHHALGALRAQRRGHEALLVVDTAAATLGAFLASDVIDLAFGGVARTLAQNRERQADHLGIRRLEAAGYDGAQAVAFSNAIAGEARAGRQRTPSAHQPQDLDRATPTSRGRIAALRRQTAASDAVVDANAYRDHIRPFLAAWLAGDLERHDYAASLFAFDRLAAAGQDMGVVQFYRGEAFRLRRGNGDLARAAAAYRLSVNYPDAPAAAWARLGELEARAGHAADARQALETYLQRAPQAEDRALVQARLDQLGAP